MSLLDYESRFSSLRLNTRGGGERSPHKVAMLLAIIERIEHGEITANRIEFDDTLRQVFTRQFELLAGPVDRNLLKASLQQNLTMDSRRNILDVGNGWDWLECEAIVADYFAMLDKELTGQPYRKAQHRRALWSRLNNRSEGSIEFKHQNIGAVLIEMGQPYIKGYKPAYNYQQQLKQVVIAYLASHQRELEALARISHDRINKNG
ncbi:MAG: hypothetical protein M0Q95_08275 [Porticoccaceae bacterium]|nr:hypothetical protein [Porticoccaceae bacterium]